MNRSLARSLTAAALLLLSVSIGYADDTAPEWLPLKELNTSAHDLSAETYWLNGYYDKALDTYLELKKQSINNKAKEADKLNMKIAECLFFAGKEKESLDYFNDIKDPDNLNYDELVKAAMMFLRTDDTETAVRLLEKAQKIDPASSLAYVILADCHIKDKNYALAEEALLKAIKKDSHMVELRYKLAYICELQDEFESAYKQYYSISKVDSTSKTVRKNMKRLLKKTGKTEKDIIKSRKKDKFSPLRIVAEREKALHIRVGLNTDRRGHIILMKKLIFRSSADFIIYSPDYKELLYKGKKDEDYTVRNKKGSVFIAQAQDGDWSRLPDKFIITNPDEAYSSFIIRSMEYGKGFSWAGTEDRQYRGKLIVRSMGTKGFKVIDELLLEEYLYSVVPSEMMISYPHEALKSQSVIARSYAYYRIKYTHPHAKSGYDLCDSQHCQVYKGVGNEWKKTNESVDSCRDEILLYKGKAAQPLFHSNCGGHTQSSAELYGWGATGYLKGVYDGSDKSDFPVTSGEFIEWLKEKQDVYCNAEKYGWSPEHRWIRIIPADILEDWLERNYKIGNLIDIRVHSRSKAGNVAELYIKGSRTGLVIRKEHKIRRAIGPGPLRSTLFMIEKISSPDSVPLLFLIYGGGWGHGVGLCQTGAGGMADMGKSYRFILQHYYNATTIGRIQEN